MFNAIFFNYDETTASETVQRLISAAAEKLKRRGPNPPWDVLAKALKRGR